MGEFVHSLGRKLWKNHHDTKKLLRFFLPISGSQGSVEDIAKGSSAAAGKEPENPRQRLTKTQMVGLILGPVLFVLTLLFFSPEGLSKEGVAILASTLWVATWWITEAAPIAVTSLLPIVLFPLTGGLTSGVTNQYGDPTIFLFLGGFVIAIALEKWNLHRRIALNIILLVGTDAKRIVLGFMVATGFLSMWISNSATAMMMMPIALSVITHVNDALDGKKDTGFAKMVLLGVAYSASIGGLATLIGTPPNTILAGVAKELFGYEISFAQWMMFGVPISAVLLILTWYYLVRFSFPLSFKHIPGGREVIQEQKRELGKMSFEEKLVAIVFVATALAWISRTFVLQPLLGKINDSLVINDTVIAIMAAVILFLLPSKAAKNGRLLAWEDAKNLPWGILLLFGGGLAIAKGFKDTGLAQWIGEQLTVLQNVHLLVVILAVIVLVLALTEITSNTATATMMYPIMASLALALGVHPFTLMIAAGVAAASAFMLPVATPPNAVVFGTGYIRITEMAKAGFWVNIIAIILLTVSVYFFLPLVWGIDINTYPAAFMK